jgi:hypothetical protein
MPNDKARTRRISRLRDGETNGRELNPGVCLAIVHHANQYIITNGYANRSGLEESADGYLKILKLHQTHEVPFHIHVSGTLLEGLMWYRPDVLRILRELHDQGLVELIGSSYGQNIMRFFSHEYNFKQLDEQLALYRDILNVDPRTVKVFWPPERVWDTRRIAPVLTDCTLLNGGYPYVLVDDRTLYPLDDASSSRRMFDRRDGARMRDFTACRIRAGNNLIALPISRTLRWNIPPHDETSLEQMEQLLDEFEDSKSAEAAIAIYADDMEKTAGIGGWDPSGPAHFDLFLEWMSRNRSFRPVKLREWATCQRVIKELSIDVGTFVELSDQFGAGDDYEDWYFDPQWDIYRSYHSSSETKVKQRAAAGANVGLIELAWKQLLVSSWETAWHTPPCGVHGDPLNHGKPSPWIKAVASHGRHAIVIAEAAYWMAHHDDAAQACLVDIDSDGEEELILKNDKLFAVFAPRWGARLVYLFNIEGEDGKMVVGNPCDDWNWQEELNKYMRVPANHPGALTDLDFEDDKYEAMLDSMDGVEATVRLINTENLSAARGMEKTVSLATGSNEIRVAYRIPDSVAELDIECGVSPDYHSLLRHGAMWLKPIKRTARWGYKNGGVSVWIRSDRLARNVFQPSEERDFGHGRAVRIRAPSSAFTLYIGSRCRASNYKTRISRQTGLGSTLIATD